MPIIRRIERRAPDHLVLHSDFLSGTRTRLVAFWILALTAGLMQTVRFATVYVLVLACLGVALAVVQLMRFETEVTRSGVGFRTKLAGLTLRDRRLAWDELGEAELSLRGLSGADVCFWKIAFADGHALPLTIRTERDHHPLGSATEICKERTLLAHMHGKIPFGRELAHHFAQIQSASSAFETA